MDSSLVALSNELVAITEKIAPSVVVVHGRKGTPSSGVHWRKGLVVTAEHTLRRDEDVQLTLPDGETASAAVVGRDSGTDIALLRAEAFNAPVAGHNETHDVRVGEFALVIGRSPNSGPNASLGVISAVSGPWRTWRGGRLDRYIRLDATVYPGTSGGAVANCRGSVIGIATSALSRIAGLAIPAATIDRVVSLLIEKGAVPRGYLGVGLHPVPIPEEFRTRHTLQSGGGTLVLSVEENAPAGKAGIIVGDLLLEVGGVPVEQVDDLQAMLGWESVGKSFDVKLIRAGELKELTLVVAERGKSS